MNQIHHTLLRTSLAAAMTLGLRPGRFYREARLHCLNLLQAYDDGCRANCSYCGLSRSSSAKGGNSFIRVEWPAFEVDEIVSRALERPGSFERVCLSMVTHTNALDDAIDMVVHLRKVLPLPVSVLVNPSTLDDGDLEAFAAAGADIASIAIDAATEALFEKHRGAGVSGIHRWHEYWRVLEEAAIVFGPDRFGAHLIAGLGETEHEMIETVTRVRNLGGRTHLFSFFPEKGSQLENARPCPPSHFRRIQLARFLIDYGFAETGTMEFDDSGRLTGFGLESSRLDDIVDTGRPFMTSGCPGKNKECACNRPFGDGPPSDIRSFPFPLLEADVQVVRKQLATYEEVSTPREAAARQG